MTARNTFVLEIDYCFLYKTKVALKIHFAVNSVLEKETVVAMLKKNLNEKLCNSYFTPAAVQVFHSFFFFLIFLIVQ